jgi:hypothetical protein
MRPVLVIILILFSFSSHYLLYLLILLHTGVNGLADELDTVYGKPHPHSLLLACCCSEVMKLPLMGFNSIYFLAFLLISFFITMYPHTLKHTHIHTHAALIKEGLKNAPSGIDCTLNKVPTNTLSTSSFCL